MVKEYLFDANTVINIWKMYPNIFDIIENNTSVNFYITQSIAKELSKKEFAEINGESVLSYRFIKLLKHIIEDEIKDIDFKSFDTKYNKKNNSYYVNGNRISNNDFKLICICKNNNKYTLVTNDKNAIKSAETMLGASRVITIEQFIEELARFND